MSADTKARILGCLALAHAEAQGVVADMTVDEADMTARAADRTEAVPGGRTHHEAASAEEVGLG